jgi:hypothetical protein
MCEDLGRPSYYVPCCQSRTYSHPLLDGGLNAAACQRGPITSRTGRLPGSKYKVNTKWVVSERHGGIARLWARRSRDTRHLHHRRWTNPDHSQFITCPTLTSRLCEQGLGSFANERRPVNQRMAYCHKYLLTLWIGQRLWYGVSFS